MKKIIFLVIGIMTSTLGFSQSQLFIGAGGSVYIDGQSSADNLVDATSPQLHIEGEMTNNGSFKNVAGEFQITGNLVNNSSFSSTGDDVFSGTMDQAVSGTSSLISATDHFHNLILNKTSGTDLILMADIKADENIKINGGILNTGVYYALLDNTAPTSYVSSGIPGETDKFVQGELRRAVASGNSYSFSVGYSHAASAGAEGIQTAEVIVNNISGAGESILSAKFTRDVGEDNTLNLLDCNNSVDVKDRINHGMWEISDVDPTGQVDDYDLVLSPKNIVDDFSAMDYTIVKSADGISGWGFGTSSDNCDAIAVSSADPITRTGFTSFSFFQVGGAPTSVLPVELVFFDAKKEGKTSLLTWETASEENNAGFHVERSKDGIRFDKIGWIEGEGTSAIRQEYRFIDETPLVEFNYYRLVQEDFDGTSELSETRSLFFESASKINMYPNPVSKGTKTYLHVYSDTEQKIDIYLYDISGKLVNQFSSSIEKGNNTVLVPHDHLSQGVYLVSVNHNDNVSNFKLSLFN